mgnify:CR=1 FL=1
MAKKRKPATEIQRIIAEALAARPAGENTPYWLANAAGFNVSSIYGMLDSPGTRVASIQKMCDALGLTLRAGKGR